MAKADALRAPEGIVFASRVTSRSSRSRLVGNVKMIAEPAYKRLLAAEPYLRRSIPTLIVIFLIVVATSRALSLMTQRDEIERGARAMLALAAGQAAAALEIAATEHNPATAQAFLDDFSRGGLLSPQHVVAVTDRSLKLVAATRNAEGWVGRPLEGLFVGGQPLFLFGERAGVLEVWLGGDVWLAALDMTRDRSAGALVMVPLEAVLAEWRKTVSLNVTLFVLTATILIVILYAYFSQASRAAAADRLYLQAHERVDLALVRGRCGLWDWDMARGRMYWSRSMFEMLGYQPCEAMLSFGEVAKIIHPDDGDLFELAKRIVARETGQIDQVFRMRHADGRWVWMRARAQVGDPDATDLHLIGIAVDITEQRNLAQRSEVADLRLRTAIESIGESFVLWDSNNRLVMCNTKFQQDSGLPASEVVPGAHRERIEKRMNAYVTERRLPRPAS